MSGGGGWSRLLMDGDTGWHIATGRWILRHGAVPTLDPFSFTKSGEPWFAWEWLSDLIFAVLDAHFGLPGVLILSALLVAVCAGLLLRRLLDAEVNPLLALPLALLAIGVCTAHLLARPHLFTFVLFPLSLWLIERDRRATGPLVWLLAPLTALWVNLHGGWAGMVASLFILSAGHGLEAVLLRRGWTRCRRYALVGGACLAASLASPYGWRLHEHMVRYLASDWIRDTVNEFQSPKFRSEAMAQFEIVLLAAIACAGLLLARRRVAETLLLVFWAHLALTSARHAPLFVMVALPVVGSDLPALGRRLFRGPEFARTGHILAAIGRDYRLGMMRGGFWAAAAFIASLWAPLGLPTAFPSDLFPVAHARAYRMELLAHRVLTTDEWADYLLYANDPHQRVFFDGRSDFYGERLGREYLGLLNGSYDWRRRLDSWDIGVALLPPDVPLASLLKLDPDWRIVLDDGKVSLFLRRTEKFRRSALMSGAETADRYAGDQSRD